VQLRDEAGKARGDIYQLNGVERGQGLGLLLEQRAEASADHVLLQVRPLVPVNRHPFDESHINMMPAGPFKSNASSCGHSDRTVRCSQHTSSICHWFGRR